MEVKRTCVCVHVKATISVSVDVNHVNVTMSSTLCGRSASQPGLLVQRPSQTHSRATPPPTPPNYVIDYVIGRCFVHGQAALFRVLAVWQTIQGRYMYVQRSIVIVIRIFI